MPSRTASPPADTVAEPVVVSVGGGFRDAEPGEHDAVAVGLSDSTANGSAPLNASATLLLEMNTSPLA